MDGGLAAADVDEFLRGLDEWRAAAPANRLRPSGVAIRALAHSGYLDAIDEPLERFTTLVQGLDSDRARRGLAEIHGTLARVASRLGRSRVIGTTRSSRRATVAAHMARPGDRVALC